MRKYDVFELKETKRKTIKLIKDKIDGEVDDAIILGLNYYIVY